MVGIKFFFVLFGLLIVQAQCNVPSVRDDGDDSHEIVVVNTATLKIIEAVVTVATDYGISAINQLNDSSAALEEQISGIFKNLIDVLWDVIVNYLNEQESGASDFTKAAIQCIKDEGDVFKREFLNFTSEIADCQVETTTMILNSFLPILVDIQNTNNIMKNLTDEITQCANDDNSECVDKISDEMDQELTKLGGVLSEDIASIGEFLENIGNITTLCQEGALDKYEKISTDLAQNISECITNSINPNN